MMATPSVMPSTHQFIGITLVKYKSNRPAQPVGGPGKTGIKEPTIPISISRKPASNKKVSICFFKLNKYKILNAKTVQRI